jgi:hypothetical protein
MPSINVRFEGKSRHIGRRKMSNLILRANNCVPALQKSFAPLGVREVYHCLHFADGFCS